MEITPNFESGNITVASTELDSDLAKMPLVFEVQILKPELVEAFLTTVGMNANVAGADQFAKELITHYKPYFLSDRFSCHRNFYTRAELNLLYFNYLVRCCGVDGETALTGSEDEEFWQSIFSNSEFAHAKEFEAYLPPLNGPSDIVKKAIPIRRKLVLDLVALKQLLLDDDHYDMSREISQYLTIDGLNMLELMNIDIAGVLGQYIGTFIERDLAADWVGMELVHCNKDWLINFMRIEWEKTQVMLFKRLKLAQLAT